MSVSKPGVSNSSSSTYPIRDPRAVAGAGRSGGSAAGSAQATGPSGRIASLDALRGFDMFWIVGGQGAVVAAGALLMALCSPWLPNAEWVTWLRESLPTQVKHADWVGFRAEDLIMPLFLFLVGASMPLSLGKRLAAGQSKLGIYRHVILRVAILWIFGMIAQGNLLTCDRSQIQVFSNTLQAIAVGYFLASIAVLHFPKLVQAVLAILLMVGYWLLLLLVPFGEHAKGTIQPAANLAIHIDRLLLGDFMNPDPTYAYAWILPGMTFTATVLLGVMAGHLLCSERSGWMKVVWLILSGAACLALGWFWAGGFDGLESLGEVTLVGDWKSALNKHLWSSSMVLWAGGWSYLLLALFYLVIDVLKMRWAGSFFIVIGANAILAYMLPSVVSFDHIASKLVGGACTQIGALGMLEPGAPPTLLSSAAGPLAELLLAATAFAVLWILLYYLYRKGTFLKV
jgi:predicted acyltransferase